MVDKMISRFKKIAILASALLVSFGSANTIWATPILKSNVSVQTSIVTVSDMFEDAGNWAEEALFRAPAPGTVGDVPLETVRMAAQRIGLTEFENAGLLSVKVARQGVMVGEELLTTTIQDQMQQSGTITQNMQVQLELSNQWDTVYAEVSDNPLTLEQIRFFQGSNSFSVRLLIAGRSTPIDVDGRLYFTINAPHLTRTLPAGSVIENADITMRPISAQLADATGVPAVEDLIGKQVRRQMREGILVRNSDVANPIVIARNDTITLYLKTGQMTLTVRGQALNDASRGETVSVLNLVSNRVVRGVAVNPGAVEIAPQAALVAAL